MAPQVRLGARERATPRAAVRRFKPADSAFSPRHLSIRRTTSAIASPPNSRSANLIRAHPTTVRFRNKGVALVRRNAPHLLVARRRICAVGHRATWLSHLEAGGEAPDP